MICGNILYISFNNNYDLERRSWDIKSTCTCFESCDSPDDNTGILKHGFKTTKSQPMITELQNDRSLFLLNRHNIFKLLSKKNISAIFLVENDFETGI